MRKDHYPDPVGCLMSPIPFRLQDRLKQLIWRLADVEDNGRYWMLAFFMSESDIDKLSDHYSVSREVWQHGHWIPAGTGGSVLVALPLHSDFFISDMAGTSHHPGFHFIAVKPGSETDILLSELHQCPEKHLGLINSLTCDKRLVFWDSLFEVKPFGEEDRDHIEIILPSSLTRKELRDCIYQNYRVPYYVIETEWRSFLEWEINGDLSSFVLQSLEKYSPPSS